MQRTEEQDLAHADMADPEVLNRIIWFSVKGNTPMPGNQSPPSLRCYATRIAGRARRDRRKRKTGWCMMRLGYRLEILSSGSRKGAKTDTSGKETAGSNLS
jgi:hypothetical protein